MAGLLHCAAGQAALTGDYALLTAAVRLTDPGETTTPIKVRTGRHAALF